MNQSKMYPVVGLMIGIIAVSTASILIRYAQNGAPSIVIAANRLILASLVITPIAYIQFKKNLFKVTSKEFFFLLLSGLFLALHFAAWITSLEKTSIASSVVLVTTTPLWVALFSPILLKEKNNSGIWIGLFLSLVGSSLVALSNDCSFSSEQLIRCDNLSINLNQNTFLGNFLALFGAWMAAGYMMAGRKLRSTIPLIKYVTFVHLISSFFLLFFVLNINKAHYSY